MEDIDSWEKLTNEQVGVYLSDKKDSINVSQFADGTDTRYQYETGVENKNPHEYLGKIRHKYQEIHRNPLSTFSRNAWNGLMQLPEGVAEEAVNLGEALDVKLLNYFGGDKDFEKKLNVGATALRKKLKNWFDEYKFENPERIKENKFVADLGQGAGSLFAALGLTLATKSPNAAAGLFGVSQAGNLTSEMRDRGIDIDRANTVGLIGGTIEGSLEKIGLHMWFENFATKKLGTFLAKQAATEFTQEASQTAAEESLMRAYGGRINEKTGQAKTVLDIAKESVYSGIMGAILGFAGGAVSIPGTQAFKSRAENTLVESGMTEEQAKSLINERIYGSPEQQKELLDIVNEGAKQVQINNIKKQLMEAGVKESKANEMAYDLVVTPKELGEDLVETLNKEADNDTLLNGSYEDDVKDFIEKENVDIVAEAFDVKEELKEKFMTEGGVQEEEAEAASTLVENFAKTVYNLTGETPREYIERKGLNVLDERYPADEDEVIDESELTEEEIARLDAKEQARMEEEDIPFYQESLDIARENEKLDAENPAYDGETININGVDKTVYNSEGQRIAKSKEALENFYRWFGDSKVVDEQGRPLVVYHGTNAEFDTFKGTKILNSSEGVGFNFAVKKDIAEGFGKVMPVYLKLENPVYAYSNIDLVSDTYEDDFEIENQEAIRNAVYKVKENLEQKGYTFYNEVDSDMLDTYAERSQAQEVLDGLLDLGSYIQEDYDAETLYNDIRQAEMDAFGIDGYVTNNYGATGGKVYIAFESNQIKSTSNRGTYSESENNIYYQEGDDRDLYATHNMSLAGVREALKLGGLAMPSLAMRKVSQGNINQFGDIVFVANERLATPSRTNEVYDRDAWTPNLSYAIKYDLKPEAQTFIKDVLERVGQRQQLTMYVYNITENLTSPQSNDMAIELYHLDKMSKSNKPVHFDRNSTEYLDWYDEHFTANTEPYLWTENASNTDMVRKKFTLDNMMKILRKQEKSGGGFIGDYIFDVYKLLNFRSQKFKNLKEIKKNRSKLVSREEQKEALDKLNEDFLALAEELKKDGEDYGFGDATYGLGLALIQDNDEKIVYWLNDRNLQSDDAAVKKVKDFIERMKNIPTDYFEVKPRRAVDFSEFSGVIIPEGAQYDEVARILEKQHFLNVERVEKGNEAQYEQALNNIQANASTTFFQSAFAGSGVDYDRPSLEAIGSGEGAQAHGWGLYYALDREVAEGYRERSYASREGQREHSLNADFETLTVNGKPLLDVYNIDMDRSLYNDLLYKPYGTVEAEIEDRIAGWEDRANDPDYSFKDYAKEKIDAYKRLKEDLFNNGMSLIKKDYGQVHEVDIPENPYLLDEQKSYREQSDFVKQAIQEIDRELQYPERKEKIFDNKDDAIDFYDSKIDEFEEKANGYQRFLPESFVTDDGKYGVKYVDDYTINEPLIGDDLEITGEGIYSRIARQLGSQKAASELLEKHGVKGITYFGRTDGRCFVIFNPEDVRVIQKFYQGEKIKRGSYNPKTRTIELFKQADHSTIIHELGHVFTMDYVKILEEAGRTDELKGFYEWLGINDISEATTETWEKMARGFETYIMEGQAPNISTQNLFDRLRHWLVGVYQDLKGKVIKPEEINNDVREFFDKMLAQDEEMPDITSLKGRTEDILKIIQAAQKGESISVNGLNIEDVKKLVKASRARLPRMPKTLEQDIRASGGIDIQLAKSLGIYDEKKGNRSGFFKKNGAIDREDSLIEFLQDTGYLEQGETDTYEQTAELQDKAIELLEKADRTYTADRATTMEARQELESIASEAMAELSSRGIKEKELFSALKTLKSVDMTAINKDTLKYLKSQLKSLEKDYKKFMKNTLRNQRKDFTEKQNEMIDFIKAMPLTGEDKVKLLNKVKKAKFIDDFNRAAREIFNKGRALYENEQKKLFVSMIKKEIRKSKPTEVTKQRYDYENNKLFADLRKWNNLTQAQAQEELAKIEVNEDKDQTDLIRIRFLNYKANGMDSSIELMEEVYNDIINAKEAGKLAKGDIDVAKAVNRELLKRDVLKSIEQNDADKNTFKTKFTNLYRRGLTNLYSMLNSIASKEIADRFEMETVINNAEIKTYKHIENLTNEILNILNLKSKGQLLDHLAGMGRIIDNITDTEGRVRELSKLHILDIYNAMKNEKTKENYLNAYGEEQLARVLRYLTPQDIMLADILMEDVNTLYPETNKVYIENYGMDLKKVDNYWMATSEHHEDTDLLGESMMQQTVPSFLKERVKGSVVPIPKNAWSKYLKHVKQSIYLINTANKYKELADTFKSSRVKNAIQTKYGEGVYKELRSQIDRLSLNGKSEDLNYLESAFGTILNNFVVAKIAVAPTVFVGQLTSITNYSESIKTGQFYKNFAEGLAHPKQTINYMKKVAGDFLESRYKGGYSEAISRVLSEAEDANKKKYTLSIGTKYNVVNALTSWVRTGDIGAIIFGGYAQIKSNIENGMSLEDATKKFEFDTLRSQQSSNAASLSSFQQSKGFARMFLAFKNTQHQYLRKLADSIISYERGEIGTDQLAKTVLNYAVVQTSMYVIAKNLVKAALGLSGDDDDLTDGVIEQILIGSLDAIPILSDLLRYTYKRLTKQYAGGIVNMPGVDDIEKAINKLAKQKKDVYDYVDIISPLIEGTTSLPVQRFKGMLKKYIGE